MGRGRLPESGAPGADPGSPVARAISPGPAALPCRAAPALFFPIEDRTARETGMKAAYIRLMDAIQRICMIVAGTCLVAITVIIPWGVFTRYVLAVGSSWPEPLSVLLMLWFRFTAAAVCDLEHRHLGLSIMHRQSTRLTSSQ